MYNHKSVPKMLTAKFFPEKENRYFENLQTRLFKELGYPFNIIGMPETRITESNHSYLHRNILGYRFEFVPTPLAAVGMFIDEKYRVIEVTSSHAFLAV